MGLSLDLVFPEGFWVTLPYVLFFVSSDQRLHSRCYEQGRRARIHNSCRCQQTVQAEEQSLSAHRGKWELARTNKDPAGVWGETGRRRLPFHGTHALWGGQVRLCPSFQRLPKDVQRGERQRAKPMWNWPRLKSPVWLKIAFSVWPGIFPGCGENWTKTVTESMDRSGVQAWDPAGHVCSLRCW